MNFGIAYHPKGSGRRSGGSSPRTGELFTWRSATGGQTQEAVVDTEVLADHRGSCVEKAQASGEPGAWKACMPGSEGDGWKRAARQRAGRLLR